MFTTQFSLIVLYDLVYSFFTSLMKSDFLDRVKIISNKKECDLFNSKEYTLYSYLFSFSY